MFQRVAAETKSKGGILIPEKGQKKGLEATVMAVGPGLRYLCPPSLSKWGNLTVFSYPQSKLKIKIIVKLKKGHQKGNV